MRFCWVVCATLLLTIVLPIWSMPVSALPFPGDELVNAGFDRSLDASGAPDGWSRYASKFGTARVSVDNEVKHSGTASLKVEVGANSTCTVSQYLHVSEPGAFTFSCMARTAAQPTNGVQVFVEWFKAVDWPQRVEMVGRTLSSAVLYGDDTWQRVGAVAMKPEEADLALVAITVGDPQAEAGTYWLDDAEFGPGARPAPLLGNPGFEFDIDGDGVPDNWGRSYYGEGWEIVRDTTVSRSGVASARLTGHEGHGSRAVLSTASPYFVPPKRLRVSFWYKGNGASDNIIDFLPGEGALAANGTVYYQRHNVKLELPREDWTQVVREFDVPEEAREFGRMRVDFLMYQRGEGVLWLDDFRLEVIE